MECARWSLLAVLVLLGCDSHPRTVPAPQPAVRREYHDDPRVTAAIAHARSALPALHREFAAGLPAGEAIELRSRFARADTTEAFEWMWVQVRSWDGDSIGGLLVNDPVRTAEQLHRGSPVTVHESQVQDWIRFRADGTTEGGEVQKVVRAIGAEAPL